jgi:hypothetical protein
MNVEILKKINKIIGINQEIIEHDYNLLTDGYAVFAEDLPKNYHEKTDIRYPQLFEDRVGFLPNLSILDLLFMEGPNTKQILLGNNYY